VTTSDDELVILRAENIALRNRVAACRVTCSRSAKAVTLSPAGSMTSAATTGRMCREAGLSLIAVSDNGLARKPDSPP